MVRPLKTIAVTTATNIKGQGGRGEKLLYQIKPPPLIKSDTLVTGMAESAWLSEFLRYKVEKGLRAVKLTGEGDDISI